MKTFILAAAALAFAPPALAQQAPGHQDHSQHQQHGSDGQHQGHGPHQDHGQHADCCAEGKDCCKETSAGHKPCCAKHAEHGAKGKKAQPKQ